MYLVALTMVVQWRKGEVVATGVRRWWKVDDLGGMVKIV